jgi:hypothetical protein
VNAPPAKEKASRHVQGAESFAESDQDCVIVRGATAASETFSSLRATAPIASHGTVMARRWAVTIREATRSLVEESSFTAQPVPC